MSRHYELGLEEAMGLLAELGRRLAAEGIHADVRLVGGIAVMLSGSERRTTKDIDASYAPKPDVERIAAQMAAELDLPGDWLNDHAKAFIPDGAEWVEVRTATVTPLPGVGIGRADEKTLLAMKMAAERDGDLPDIAHLARKLGLTEPEELVAAAYEQYGEASIPLSGDRDDYLIVAEEALARGRYWGRGVHLSSGPVLQIRPLDHFYLS